MPILTIITAIRAHPIKAVKTLFDCFEEITASYDSVRYFAKFGTWVRIKIDGQRALIFQGQIMTKLALFALLTDTCLEVGAQCSLFVH